MDIFQLPAGSTVKFGTTTSALYPILREGIPAQVARPGLQVMTESSVAGIFVGELMAYFGACAAFCQATNSLHAAHQETMGKFVRALQNTHGEKPLMPELEAIAAEAGLPLVLEIELGEACTLSADPHFVGADEAAQSWDIWRSGALQCSAGIPANWIKKFYFPRLLEFKDTGNARSPRMLEQTTDSALMVGGLMQVWHKDTPADLQYAFQKQYGRIDFSQSARFDESGLERFFNLNAMLDPATRLLNQMTIWQDIDALAKKQQIPLG